MNESLLAALFPPVRRKIFVSYHHDSDQGYYLEFSRVFSDTYEAVRDGSLDRIVDSDDADYVMRRIRENYITGTSCTIVLCGPETRWRKYVDWEIKATLDKEHGLVGVRLPNNPPDRFGNFHKPDRLQDNIDSGFAVWVEWDYLVQGTGVLRQCIEAANARRPFMIDNSRSLRERNG